MIRPLKLQHLGINNSFISAALISPPFSSKLMNSLISQWSEPKGWACPSVGVYLPICLLGWLLTDQALLPLLKSPSASVSSVCTWPYGIPFPKCSLQLSACSCWSCSTSKKPEVRPIVSNLHVICDDLFSLCKRLKPFFRNNPASQAIMAGKIIISGFFFWRRKASLIKGKLGTHLKDN